MSWFRVPSPSARQTCQNICRAARQTIYLRKLQYSWSGSRWEMTVVFHRSAPLQGKAVLGAGKRDLGSPCGLTCSVAWQCHGGGWHSPGREPRSSSQELWGGSLISSGQTSGWHRQGRPFLSQRRRVCSKAHLPGEYPPFLFLAFSSSQFAFALELLRILFE